MEDLDDISWVNLASTEQSPSPEDAIKLVRLFCQWSEKTFSAGWITNLEESMWQIWHDGELSGDYAEIPELANRAGGWWSWPEDLSVDYDSAPKFVTKDEWLRTRQCWDKDPKYCVWPESVSSNGGNQ